MLPNPRESHHSTHTDLSWRVIQPATDQTQVQLWNRHAKVYQLLPPTHILPLRLAIIHSAAFGNVTSLMDEIRWSQMSCRMHYNQTFIIKLGDFLLFWETSILFGAPVQNKWRWMATQPEKEERKSYREVNLEDSQTHTKKNWAGRK